ncbi:MAG: hypothetical protein ACKVOW_07235 [Chitinophagaceae bacterium]
MKKNSMYYDTHRTKMCRDIYKPSSNIVRFFKTLWSVLIVGHSPISDTSYAKRKPH